MTRLIELKKILVDLETSRGLLTGRKKELQDALSTLNATFNWNNPTYKNKKIKILKEMGEVDEGLARNKNERNKIYLAIDELQDSLLNNELEQQIDGEYRTRIQALIKEKESFADLLKELLASISPIVKYAGITKNDFDCIIAHTGKTEIWKSDLWSITRLAKSIEEKLK